MYIWIAKIWTKQRKTINVGLSLFDMENFKLIVARLKTSEFWMWSLESLETSMIQD